MKYRLVIAVALCLGGVAWSVARAFQPVRPGDRPGDFRLTSTDGNAFRLAEQAGKAVLVNFFSTW